MLYVGVLLTMISLMHALDPVSHCTEMNSDLNKLISIDPLRANYYTDLRKIFVDIFTRQAMLCTVYAMAVCLSVCHKSVFY